MSFPQPEGIRFAQAALTTAQWYLLGVAADEAAGRKDISEQAKDNLERLSVFCYDVSTDPSQYPVTGKTAASIRSVVRRATGPGATVKNPNKRKQRQEARQGGHKLRRKNRREIVAKFNADMDAAYEAELAASAAAIEADPSLDTPEEQSRIAQMKAFFGPKTPASAPTPEIILP